MNESAATKEINPVINSLPDQESAGYLAQHLRNEGCQSPLASFRRQKQREGFPTLIPGHTLIPKLHKDITRKENHRSVFIPHKCKSINSLSNISKVNQIVSKMNAT